MTEISSGCVADRREDHLLLKTRCLAPAKMNQDEVARIKERVRALEQMLSESGLRPLPDFTETELANLCAG